ncbi:hypothetical protein RxyAA322_18690 [Rubrobacter xylanophilus]|uniref:Sulfotransferase n=1 Tax=Rubrobacter xylanophilus TaxID=49319 RepID=A0A510HL22_9ACTN|nr:sulfotransferase [Rubrobacter xylanophilus]BBL80015.1 hypothetical protein RxyAA322_18690 [Rubrobacter xylanophilus]
MRGGGPYGRRGPVELLAGTLYLDLDRDPRTAVLLAGSGRSGTSWVSTLINCRNEYRYVFEPFEPRRVPRFAGLGRRRYLRREEAGEEFLAAVRAVLSGRLRSRWADRFNRKFVSRRRLVKEIRANLMLGWLRENFPQTPMLLLLRHPFAVAASRARLGWRDNLEEMLGQPKLLEDFLSPFEAELRRASTPFERHVLAWCVENLVPLRQLSAREVGLLFYEEILLHPEEGLRPAFAALGRPVPPEALAAARRARRGGLEGWRALVGEDELLRGLKALRSFGLDRVYGAGPLPDRSGALAIMREGVAGGARE